jgi:ornithine carbamoyltransferase
MTDKKPIAEMRSRGSDKSAVAMAVDAIIAASAEGMAVRVATPSRYARRHTFLVALRNRAVKVGYQLHYSTTDPALNGSTSELFAWCSKEGSHD